MANDQLANALEALMPQIQQSLLLVSESQSQTVVKSHRPQLPEASHLQKLDPLCTDRATLMSWYFDTFGVIGLAYYVVKIAEYEAQDEADKNAVDTDQDDSDGEIPVKYDKSWDLILDDDKLNTCRTIIYYLSSVPAELVDSLIKCNLPSRMQEASFRLRVEGYVKPLDRQGTYGIWIAVDRVPVSSTQEDRVMNNSVGKSVTIRQMMNLHRDMSLYINVNDPMSAQLAREIDTTFSGSEKEHNARNYKFQRRYGSGGNKDDFGYHEAWLDFIELHYISWAKDLDAADDHLLDVPLERCFVYVGLSKSVRSRMPNHWKHSASISSVIGLLTATLEHLYPRAFSVVGSSFQIFKTVDKAHIGLDEKLSMILAGAYPWDGGLNAGYGGRSRGPVDNSAGSIKRLNDSRSEIEASGLLTLNISESIRKIEHANNSVTQAESAPNFQDLHSQSLDANRKRASAISEEVKDLEGRIRFGVMHDMMAKFKDAKADQRREKRRLRSIDE